MTTPSRAWDLADADPVGAATGWVAGHPDLIAEWQQLATGEGRFIGVGNAPPYPRLRTADTDTDLGLLRGLNDVVLTIEVLGDPDGRPGKARLRRFAVIVAEVLDELTTVPVVGGCVFSRVSTVGPQWSPLQPGSQPRYLLTSTLRSRPAWGR